MFHMSLRVPGVGIRELRLHGREVIDRVRAGETIEVTDRGRPVARLVPILERSPYDELIAQGLIQPARGELVALMEQLGLPRAEGHGAGLGQVVQAERESYYEDRHR